MENKVVEWNVGWNYIHESITNLMSRIRQGGSSDTVGNVEANICLYTIVYKMCTQKPPNNHAEKLYAKYWETFTQLYTNSAEVPLLNQKRDEYSILQEFVKVWENHKILLKWMSYTFGYLDRYYIHYKQLPTLNEVGDACFRDLVYREANANVRDAVISFVNKEREGEEIDRALLKNVISVFVELDRGTMEACIGDFEQHMLKDTGEYYSRKASNWIVKDNYAIYMSKAEECLRRESDRASYYNLQTYTATKLVKIVKHCLLVVYATQLVEKKLCECGRGDSLTVDSLEGLSKKFIANLNLEQEAEDVAMSQA